MASSINASTSGAGGVITTADNTGILNLQTASTNAVTIDASQNVGIGTTSPSSYGKLAVSGVFGISNSGASGYAWRYFRNTSTPTAYCYDDGTNVQLTVQTAGALQFGTNDTERMRIDSSGNCFWNGTSIIENTKYNFYFTSSTNGIGSKVDTTSTSYHVRWHNPNGVVGGVYTSGSNTTYTTSSDYRLKENILPMTGALDKVMQLNPVTYTWKSDGSNGQGFIAHELQAIVPECVGGEKDAVNEDGSINPQGVDTSFLVATLTAAIQEQQTIINDLKARVTALEAK